MDQVKCVLCEAGNEQLIYANEIFRIILVNDIFYPGYVRLILNQHIAEMSDLDETTASMIFSTLLKIERCIRSVFKPDKINLASLGNMVPHVHWHIIPRYKNDRNFPNPIWGSITHPDYSASDTLLQLQAQLISNLKDDFSHSQDL